MTVFDRIASPRRLTATDFLSVEVYTITGLVTYYILFFIDIASRTVHIAGMTPHPDNRWMTRIARNLTDTEDGFRRGKRHLILDRNPSAESNQKARAE